jgi:hypothetical protein
LLHFHMPDIKVPVLDVLYSSPGFLYADNLWIPVVNEVPEVLDRGKQYTIRNTTYSRPCKIS